TIQHFPVFAAQRSTYGVASSNARRICGKEHQVLRGWAREFHVSVRLQSKTTWVYRRGSADDPEVLATAHYSIRLSSAIEGVTKNIRCGIVHVAHRWPHKLVATNQRYRVQEILTANIGIQSKQHEGRIRRGCE